MPIDDELRQLFSQRVADVAPPPSVMRGVEARARRMRRSRNLAAGGSTVAVVAALALLVPLFASGGAPAPQDIASPGPAPSASASPSASPSQAPSPEVSAAPSAGPVAPAPPPANVVSWEVRGNPAEGPEPSEIQAAVEERLGPGAGYRAVFHYAREGVAFTGGQAWAPGERARSMFYTTGSECGAELVLGPVTSENPAALAYQPSCIPQNPHDRVVVVGAPRVGQVSYGVDGSALRPAASPPGWEGVFELELDAPAGSRYVVQILDGNGDLDNPMYEGPLADLLCGSGCE